MVEDCIGHGSFGAGIRKGRVTSALKSKIFIFRQEAVEYRMRSRTTRD